MSTNEERPAINEPVYELDFVLERADLVAYEGYAWAHSAFFDLAAPILAVALGLLVPFLMFLVVQAFDAEWPPILHSLFVVGALGGLVIFFSMKRTVKRQFQTRIEKTWTTHSFDEELTLGKRHLAASPNEIALISPYGKTVRNWSAVRTIATTNRHAFILADTAIIVPRRAFNDDSRFEEFVKSIEQWWSSWQLRYL